LDFQNAVNGPVGALLLVAFGFVIGGLSGIFGVGGGFLAAPLLNILFGIPYEIAIGSSLCQMIGTSISGSIRHRALGNIDLRLALIIIIASALGLQLGAGLIELLKGAGAVTIASLSYDAVDFTISIVYILLLTGLGTAIFLETRKARKSEEDVALVKAKCLRRFHELALPPVISLPRSGVEAISLPMMAAAGFVAGIAIGFLGVGGGFILVPVYIYLFCIPTIIAIGTGLFQIIFISIIATATHAYLGNVNLPLVLFILIGSTAGAQAGALVSSRVKQKNLRYYFSCLVMMAGLLVAGKLFFFPSEVRNMQPMRRGTIRDIILCVAIPAIFGLAVGLFMTVLPGVISRRKPEKTKDKNRG